MSNAQLAVRKEKVGDLFLHRNNTLLAWYAYDFQHPSESHPTSIVIPTYKEWSAQWGNGKGRFENPMEYDWTEFNGDYWWLLNVIGLLSSELGFWDLNNINSIENHEVYKNMSKYVAAMKEFYEFVTGTEYVDLWWGPGGRPLFEPIQDFGPITF